MSKLKMKIVDYDVSSNSIIVAFASENSKNSIDYYSACAYQPTMFDNPNNPDEVFKEIAKTGVFIASQQDKTDIFKVDNTLEKKYKQFVGKEFEYDVDSLLDRANQTVEVKNDVVIVDDIINDILIDDNDH
jgi:hypothetical protein